MRKIPATMATQHPDNALAPYWSAAGDPFVSIYQEIDEAITCFKDLDVGEYMWDWEGKHADAAVIDRLLGEHQDYFAKHQLGRDKFLTFRIPNIWEEKGYNLLQAMTVVLTGEDLSRDMKLAQRPLFEVILPMTERADQLIHMQKLFEKLARFKSKEFTTSHETNTDYLEIIPLMESFESQLAAGELLTKYVELHEQHFGYKPQYIRPFLAGSDSALSSGLLAGMIGNKLTLSRMYEFSEQSAIPIFPIIGNGCLLFRGGLTPLTLDRFLEEFPGVRTVMLQSSFRYDYPKDVVIAAIKRLSTDLAKTSPRLIPAEQQQQLIKVAERSATHYKATLNEIVGDVQPFFKAVPKRRDRRQHIGLLAYSRQMGEHKLPRAITFAAAFYSIGVPPELIGLGRTLRDLPADQLATLRAEYHNLVADFETVGGYLNRDNLATLAAANPAWQQIQDDVVAAEKVLGVEFTPSTADQKAHHALAAQAIAAVDQPKLLGELMNAMAALRRSLG